MKRAIRNLALLSVSIILALGGSELILRLVVDPIDYLVVDPVPDPVLGHRLLPHATGHDKWGYRNPEVPESARIIAIGDSHTYGVSATMRQSWPYQLGELLDETVYQFALGGYGPLEYLHLLETQTQQLNSRTILIGIYFGNDFTDAVRAAHMREHWADWRQNDVVIPTYSSSNRPDKRFLWLRDALASRSVLYGMLRVTIRPLLHYAEGSERAASSMLNERWLWNDPESPNVRTILNIRSSALDPNSPVVREGIAITQQVIDRIGAIQNDRGLNIYVVLIPTKEYVYCDLAGSEDAPENFATLCIAEDIARAQLLQQLKVAGLGVIDVTLSLRAEVKAHAQIYPQNGGSHPNGEGYTAYAHAIADQLASNHAYKQ